MMNTLVEAQHKKISIYTLILANCIPILGVLFFNWDTATILFLYWFENFVIGFFNIFKIITAEGTDGKSKQGGKFFLVPFFIVHYGIFTTIHGFFIREFFGAPLFFPTFAVIALFISHGISYYQNYIEKGEYKRITPDRLFYQPYLRIVVIHLTIMFGGALTDTLGNSIGALLALVVLKIILDIKLHTREHIKFARYDTTKKTA